MAYANNFCRVQKMISVLGHCPGFRKNHASMKRIFDYGRLSQEDIGNHNNFSLLKFMRHELIFGSDRWWKSVGKIVWYQGNIYMKKFSRKKKYFS